MDRKLDLIDKKILNELQQNGRLSIVDLAERVNLTKTPCSERVKRLEKDGVIDSYRAVLNPAMVGMNHVTMVHISLSSISNELLLEFNDAVKNISEVQSCLMIAGQFDYMLMVRSRDIAHFRDLLGEKISKLPGVNQTNSFAVMETVKERGDINMTDMISPF